MTLLGCALAKKKKKKICIVKSQPGFNATVEQFPLWVLPKENSRGLEGLLREKDSQLSSEIQAGPNVTVNASRLLKHSPPEFWLQWSTEQNTPTPARNGAVIRFYTPSAYQASGTFQVLATEESTKPPSPCSCGGSVSAFTDQGNSAGGDPHWELTIWDKSLSYYNSSICNCFFVLGKRMGQRLCLVHHYSQGPVPHLSLQ